MCSRTFEYADSEFWIVAEIAEDDVNDRNWRLTEEKFEFITCVPLPNSTGESVSSEIGVRFVCDACELKTQE